MIGYEWTSTEDGNNLHRNVLYRDDGDVARRMVPYTTAESFNPEDLWAWMARYEAETGGRVLTLAHNGNMSNGIMFPVETNPATGRPLTSEYAEQRIRWEPLYEVTQIKGDGEAHPFLSPTDEFADHRNAGAGQPQPDGRQRRRHAQVRVCPRGAQERSQDGRRPSAPTRTSLAWWVRPTPTRVSLPPKKRTTSENMPGRSRRPSVGIIRWRSSPGGSTTGGRCPRPGTPLSGHRQHPRGAVGRDDAKRSLRDHGAPHHDPLLWRMGIRGSGRVESTSRRDRLHPGRTDGRRPHDCASG